MVDFLRHCYRSTWKLFRDSDALTVGKYYFSAPDARAFPGWHNFGSRTWYDKNNEILPGLGEDLTTRHLHLSGQWPGRMPEQRTVGGEDCFANGARIADQVDRSTLIDGYPEQCWIPEQPTIPPAPPVPVFPDSIANFDRGAEFTRCGVQYLWARIIDWCYVDNFDGIYSALLAFFGPGVAVTVYPPQGNMPTVVTAVAPEWAIVCCDGTRSFQQYALMAFQTLISPVDRGAYATMPLWDTAASYIHNRIVQSLVNDTRPIFLVGHSYGAAAAGILAMRYRHATPAREIRFLFYGCPKISDVRGVELLERVQGLALGNDDDVVTTLPPDRSTLAALVALFPALNFTPYYAWQRPPFYQTQDRQGNLAPGPPLDAAFLVLFRMLQRVALGQAQDGIVGHGIAEYLRRIAIRCPDPGWPIDQEVLTLIEEADPEPGGVLVGGAPGSWRGSGGFVIGDADITAEPDGGLVIGTIAQQHPGNGGIVFGGGTL